MVSGAWWRVGWVLDVASWVVNMWDVVVVTDYRRQATLAQLSHTRSANASPVDPGIIRMRPVPTRRRQSRRYTWREENCRGCVDVAGQPRLSVVIAEPCLIAIMKSGRVVTRCGTGALMADGRQNLVFTDLGIQHIRSKIGHVYLSTPTDRTGTFTNPPTCV